MAKKKLRIVPIGGLGEVGKNMMVLEYGSNIMIIDTGIMFPENDMLGVDFIIPDFGYLNDKWHMVRGIVITHGHEDHTGAIAYVLENCLDAPVYATPLTRGLLEVKLRQAKLYDDAKLVTVKPGDRANIGPFEVEFFHMCHSIPDNVGLGIRTPLGLVVHTSDFKIDHTPVDGKPTDFATLGRLAGEGVMLLLSDSTNSIYPGWTPSERVIDSAFDEVFTEAKGRIMVATFASLVSRVQQVMNAAARHGRKLALTGTSMVENSKMARALGYLDDPDNVLVPFEKLASLPDNKIAIMMTGAQGEPSAILGRLAEGRNRLFDLKPGDTVVLSSHPIPGNEENVSRIINRLIQQGAKVVYDPLKKVHVSGHASSEEQKLILGMLRPKYFIPVHGELRHLTGHRAIARGLGMPAENIAVVENGTVVEITEDGMKIGERIPGGYVYVDGTRVGDIGTAVLRDRDKLGNDGVVVVNILVEAGSGKVLEDSIRSKGFVSEPDAQALFEEARQKAYEVINRNLNGNTARSVESALSDFFYAETRRRPTVFAVVNKV